MYTEASAAHLLRIAPSTLHWWLEGRSPRYRPVIRVEPTGSRNVTWAEFVEAGLLRSYRREHDVPLKELRDFIDRLRDEFQVPYPLADRRPYVGPGRRLLIDLQGRSHLDPEFCLVAIANGQIVLTAPGEEFYERVDWDGDQPAGWRPHEDTQSPVRINPLVRFGMPAVGGISTEAVAGELEGGASLEEVAEDFGLDIDTRPPRGRASTGVQGGRSGCAVCHSQRVPDGTSCSGTGGDSSVRYRHAAARG